MRNLQIKPEVAAILSVSIISERSVKLPDKKLSPQLYGAVNDVLSLAGGVWNKKAKAHLFATDPRERLGLALKTGTAVFDVENSAPALVAKAKKKTLQAFYTPPELADRLVKLAEINSRCICLEPSAGLAAISGAMVRAGAQSVTNVEIDPETARALRAMGLHVIEDDFLNVGPCRLGKFDRVVMNPPFAKDQDVKHVQHALQFLKTGGILVAVMASNVDRKCFDRLVAGLDYEVVPVESGAFKESGTNVATIILKIRN